MSIEKLNLTVLSGQKAMASDFNAVTNKVDEIIENVNTGKVISTNELNMGSENFSTPFDALRVNVGYYLVTYNNIKVGYMNVFFDGMYHALHQIFASNFVDSNFLSHDAKIHTWHRWYNIQDVHGTVGTWSEWEEINKSDGGGSLPTDLLFLNESTENPAGVVLNNKDSIISDEEGLLIQSLLTRFEGILQTQRLSMPVLDDITGDGIIGYSQGEEGDVLTVKSGYPIWQQPKTPDVYTKAEIDNMIGDIEELLSEI